MSGVRSVLASMWIGLYHDLGWTNPGISFSITLAAPFASAMTTSLIFWLGSKGAGAFDPARLSFVLVGAILYAHVASYAWIPTQAVAEGKNLSVFPHIYIATRSSAVYLAGRTLSAFVISTSGSAVSLAAAYLVLTSMLGTSIPLLVTPWTALLLLAALALNVPASLGLGYLLGAYSLFASKFEWALPAYVAGTLMVFSGALFPTSLLPWPLSVAAGGLPFTQFIAAARDAIIYGDLGAYALSLGYAVLGGAVLLALGLAAYSAAERKARRDGVIDRRLA
jgi:ABC-type polysaccharide/polyol phosphate export permease